MPRLQYTDNSRSACDLRSEVCAHFAGSLSRPALERVGEPPDFLIAQKPGNLRDRQLPISQIPVGEINSEISQNRGEIQAFG